MEHHVQYEKSFVYRIYIIIMLMHSPLVINNVKFFRIAFVRSVNLINAMAENLRILLKMGYIFFDSAW